MRNIVKSQHLASRVIEGQAFIINTKTSTLHELDETGSFIWALIEKKKKPDEIALALSAGFEVADTVARRDLAEFLAELEKKGLIHLELK